MASEPEPLARNDDSVETHQASTFHAAPSTTIGHAGELAPVGGDDGGAGEAGLSSDEHRRAGLPCPRNEIPWADGPPAAMHDKFRGGARGVSPAMVDTS